MSGDHPTHIVVMGVTGCGKTTVGRKLSELLSATFLDADDLHPPANIEKMSAGKPLTDEDRQPWLEAVRDWLQTQSADERNAVIACSALKRRYREIIRGVSTPVLFVHLDGSRAVIGRRLAERGGHFMPPSLLDSQFAALEPLAADEAGMVLSIDPTPEDIVRVVADFLDEERKVAQ
ncbi:gluconokinase [Rhodococcus sp. WS4]|nr:gluconokinase [Rhodococcus sp. WS4]